MSVKVRLQITGSKNHRTYRVVAIDEHKKRNGRVVENLGFVNPLVKPTVISINKDRVTYWKQVGATVSAAVEKFLSA
jgi:small subunit ribosomal protein S16